MKVLVFISWITAINIFYQENRAEKELINQNLLQKNQNMLSESAGSASDWLIFYENGDQNEKAIQGYQEELLGYEKAMDSLGMAKAHGKLARIFIHQDQLGKAAFHLEQQVKLDSAIQNPRGLGFYFDQMGLLKKKQGFREEAYDYAVKGLKIRESLDSPYELGESIAHVAQLLFELRNYRETIKYAYRLLEISNQSGSLIQKQTAYGLLSGSYEKIRWFQAGLKYQKNLKAISDSIVQQGFSELKVRHKSEIDSLEYNLNQALAEIRNLSAVPPPAPPKRDTLYPLLIALFLLICLLIVLYFLIRKYREKEDVISLAEEKYRLLVQDSRERLQESLQLISGLLMLQNHDNDTEEGFNEGYSRARTVALIWESMDSKEELTTVHVKGFLLKLCSELIKTYHVREDQVKLIFEVENIRLDVANMVPLALIVHELISNSLKYAFPGGQKGEIHVSLKEEEDRLQLGIEDDGRGFEAEQVSPDSTGYRIVNAMVNQLQGRLEIMNRSGAKVNMELYCR
jgi:two-component sensor histidine kinase